MSARRVSTGWLVLGGSVLASFVWWMLSPPARRAEPAPAPVETVPPIVAAPPEATAVKPAAPPKGRAAREAPVTTPAPAATATSAPGPLLRVTGDVAGADVFIDRTFVGKTPFETRDITAGRHQINVSADGFEGISRNVEVSDASPTDVVVALRSVLLNAAVPVVHKHRLGSCEGRLTADLKGVRYAPTTGDDGFHAPLAGLETFAVDYQDKQLRLKVKGGKSFTFTTKAANADPLFVFHRDVEKARKKLAGGA